jgi:hypothetical protein
MEETSNTAAQRYECLSAWLKHPAMHIRVSYGFVSGIRLER